MKSEDETVGYLLTCSETSLQQFHLNRLNRADLLEKQIRPMVAEWVTELALAHLVELLRLHRKKLKAGTHERSMEDRLAHGPL